MTDIAGSRFGFDADARGTNASLIECANVNGTIAMFYQVGARHWVETDPDANVRFGFEEEQRDEWSVYLRDSSRNVTLRLDLHRKMVIYADPNQEFDLYPITSALARTSGLTLRSVRYQAASGRQIGGVRQTGTTNWCEFGADGEPAFQFVETGRDDWSVYLHDASRDVQLQLDVHRNIVGYRHGDTAFDLYEINSSNMSGPHNLNPPATGRTVNRVETTTGAFVQTGPFNWVETDSAGTTRFHFVEKARDRRAVHLTDIARHVEIQLHIDRGMVTYSDVNQERFDLYEITGTASKANGRITNEVTYTDGRGSIFGTMQQTGSTTWVELDGALQTKFRFVETHRDDWTVYLYDASREVYLELDLHTQGVRYRDPNQAFDLYTIDDASVDPARLEPISPVAAKARNVRTVHFGALDGTPLGSLRQVGATAWHEIGADGTVRFHFEETKRTTTTVRLHDASRNVTLVVDMPSKRIHYSDSANEFMLYLVVRSSAVMHGWLASEIEFGHGPDLALGIYRRVDDGQWAEFDTEGNARFFFDEVALDDWTIRLHDGSRNVAIDLDLRLQRVLYGVGTNTTTPLYLILSERIESGIWLHSETITSRSALTHDYAPDGNDMNEQAVYRTSVSFTAVTRWVDIWASKEVAITVEGEKHTVSPVVSARVMIPPLAKISISVPAVDLDCPKLTLRTNLMNPEHRHPIYPDVEAHKKIVGLPDGALSTDRHRLGIDNAYSDEDLAHVQRAMQNIASTKQYTYNRRPHGVHHDRVLHPANMEHPHFTMDFGQGRPRYQPLRPEEVAQHTAGAELVSADVGQDFLGIGHFFHKVTKVVVHTVKAVAHDVVKTAEEIASDVVQTAENVGHDVINTIEDVGEDLVHGDILKAGQDLWQGGEHLGSDLTKGAMHVVGDAVSGVSSVVGDVASGAGQLIVITLHAADEAVKFVLTHTGAVGRLIQGLLDKIGAAIEAVVGWLLDALGWGDIVHTHDALIQRFNQQLDDMASYPAQLKALSDTFFADLSDRVSGTIDTAIAQLEPSTARTQQPSPGPGHSGAVEKIEWLLGKLMHHSEAAPAFASPLSSTTASASHPSMMDDLVQTIETKLGRDGDKVLGAIEAAVGDVSSIFSDPSHTPEYLICALLEIVEVVAVVAIDAVSVVIDIVLDALQAIFVGMKDAVNAEWDIPFLGELYRTATHGRELTMLGLVSLIMAIPLTIVSKAEIDEAPFADVAVAAQLSSLTGTQKGLGFSYGIAQIILAPLSIVQDVRTAAGAATDGVNSMMEGWGEPLPSPTKPLTSNILSVFDWLLNASLFFTGAPAPIDEPYIVPWIDGAGDVFERPSYFGHVTYWYLFAGFGVNSFLTVGDALSEGKPNQWVGRVSTVFNCAFGIALMGLMGTIDAADRSKGKGLASLGAGGVHANLHGQDLFKALEDAAKDKDGHTPYWTFDANGNVVKGKDRRRITVEEWEDSMRNFEKFASSGGGIPRKGFGNIMDSFPAIGQICAFPDLAEDTFGLSLIVTGLFDTLGHLGEGITVIDRTARNELV